MNLSFQAHFSPYIEHKTAFYSHFQTFYISDESFVLVIIQLHLEDYHKIMKNFAFSKLRDYHLSFISPQTVNSLVITDDSKNLNEIDTFHKLKNLTPDLKKVQIFENPLNPAETLGFIIATYLSHEAAKSAKENLQYISTNPPNVFWRDPLIDYAKPIAYNTKALVVSQISTKVSLKDLKETLDFFGIIESIRFYNGKKGRKAMVVYDCVVSVKNAIAHLNGKRFHGAVLKAKPCKMSSTGKTNEKPEKDKYCSYFGFSRDDKIFLNDKLIVTAERKDRLNEENAVLLKKASNVMAQLKIKRSEKLENIRKRIEEKQRDNHFYNDRFKTGNVVEGFHRGKFPMNEPPRPSRSDFDRRRDERDYRINDRAGAPNWEGPDRRGGFFPDKFPGGKTWRGDDRRGPPVMKGDFQTPYTDAGGRFGGRREGSWRDAPGEWRPDNRVKSNYRNRTDSWGQNEGRGNFSSKRRSDRV